MRSPLHDTCPCTPRPTSVTAPAGDVDDAQPTEPVLVAREGDTIAVGRDGERALPHRPRRLGVLERLVDERLVVVPQVEPAVVVAHADAGAVGHVAHLLDRARPAELVADLAVERDALHTRRVPRHVGDVPRLPHQRRAARRDVGIEHEVGGSVVEPLRRDRRRRAANATPRPGRRRRRRTCRRRLTTGASTVRPGADGRDAVRRAPGHRLQPQVAVAADVDDRRSNRAPRRSSRRRSRAPTAGCGDVVRIRSGPPASGIVTIAVAASHRTVNASVTPSGDGRGSARSRPERHISTVITKSPCYVSSGRRETSLERLARDAPCSL